VSSWAVPRQQLLTVEILQLNAIKSCLYRISYITDLVAPVVFLTTSQHGPSRKSHFQQYLYCCTLIHCCGGVFTKLLPRNGPGISAHLTVVA
jgi:hypothetical protein